MWMKMSWEGGREACRDTQLLHMELQVQRTALHTPGSASRDTASPTACAASDPKQSQSFSFWIEHLNAADMEKMSRVVPLNPTFIPPSYGVLKSLLENPLKLPLHHDDAFFKEKDKEKKLEDEPVGSTIPQSAFLGPTLWDKTLPYDGDTFQLEYMDLEEFLSENGIPPSQSPHEINHHQSSIPPAAVNTPSVINLSSRASTSILPVLMPPNCMHSPVRSAGQILLSNRNTPSPIDPESIQVAVGYEPDPADLALSSVPGQEMFDPRKRKFSEDELKPQPMIKKARKIFISEELKIHTRLCLLLSLSQIPMEFMKNHHQRIGFPEKLLKKNNPKAPTHLEPVTGSVFDWRSSDTDYSYDYHQ
uniref:HLF transcription factor, PAR bZIP family member n=1 Tax=Leptobrachium leishanense TaxID=445787 RepID=A0A8C5QWS2_9ANUR